MLFALDLARFDQTCGPSQKIVHDELGVFCCAALNATPERYQSLLYVLEFSRNVIHKSNPVWQPCGFPGVIMRCSP